MAMYYYASKISAIACGTRCRQTVLQKSRGQRDRDKYASQSDDADEDDDNDNDEGGSQQPHKQRPLVLETNFTGGVVGGAKGNDGSGGASVMGGESLTAEGVIYAATTTMANELGDGVRYRRRYSEQLDAYDIELGFQKLEVSTAKSTKSTFTGYGVGNANMDSDIVQYDIPKNTYKRTRSDVNYESSVLGSGGIMYINGRIVSGPLESLIEVLVPKTLIDFDKEFIFSFLLSSRLFLRPHELLGKLLSSVPDSASLESLVALLAEWTNKFPYDYRDERMMSHVKHIVARCSNTNLEGVVSEILSALLKRLTDLERHEEDLRACQTNSDKPDTNTLDCPTASQYAQILCRLEKKLSKQIGPEEFLQCSSNVLLDKQKKWDQPATSGGPPGAQDPKKTCNLETYLDWSARLRLFVCNEILQCTGIRDRSKTVELWSGVAQYCLLVGNYNSATAILESLESPPIARLKITWSKLQVTCQQLDCMQRHAEGHGDLWHKQAIILNENHQKTDTTAVVFLTTSNSSVTMPATALTTTTATTLSTLPNNIATVTAEITTPAIVDNCEVNSGLELTMEGSITGSASGSGSGGSVTASTATSGLSASDIPNSTTTTTNFDATTVTAEMKPSCSSGSATKKLTTTKPKGTTATTTKPNDWVVIPVFADIVKLALAEREDCLQRLPNGHINIVAFDRMAAIVGAFTKHMHAVKSATEAPSPGEYATFCQHMQRTSKLSETELMMASFDCEEPNNAEKLMYDLN